MANINQLSKITPVNPVPSKKEFAHINEAWTGVEPILWGGFTDFCIKVFNDPSNKDILTTLRKYKEPMATYFSPFGNVLAWQWRVRGETECRKMWRRKSLPLLKVPDDRFSLVGVGKRGRPQQDF